MNRVRTKIYAVSFTTRGIFRLHYLFNYKVVLCNGVGEPTSFFSFICILLDEKVIWKLYFDNTDNYIVQTMVGGC